MYRSLNHFNLSTALTFIKSQFKDATISIKPMFQYLISIVQGTNSISKIVPRDIFGDGARNTFEDSWSKLFCIPDSRVHQKNKKYYQLIYLIQDISYVQVILLNLNQILIFSLIIYSRQLLFLALSIMKTPDHSQLFYGRNNQLNPNISNPNRDNAYSQSQAASFIDENVKKSPVKYRYLTVQQAYERKRQFNIFWLECFAMFIFIYSSTCSKINTGVDLHFFVGILIAIPICAMQTGANLNPAVSFAMTFKAKQKKLFFQSLLWIYIKAQIIGAILSMLLAIELNGVYRSPLHPQYLSEDSGLNEFRFGVILQIILSQAVGVFILIFMILYCTGPYSFITNNGAKFFYIATFVYIGRKFAVSSNNQINIALSISQAFVGIFECDLQGFKYIFIWILGDVLGVFFATSLYNNVFEPLLEYLQEHKTEKQMLKTQNQRHKQIKESKILNKKNQFEIELEERRREDIKKGNQNKSQSDSGKEYKNYSKKLQYF